MSSDDDNTTTASESLLIKMWRSIKTFFGPVSFITLHYAYFIITCFVASLVFWGSSTPAQSVRYIDSVFLAVSAMTEAGLNTINLSTLNTWQQIILFFLIMMGSSIFVSIAVLHIRKTAFEQKLEELAARKRRRNLRRSMTSMFTRQRNTPADEHEQAVASGVLRGQVMKDPDPAEDYQPTFAARTRTRSNTDVDADEEGNEKTNGQELPPARIRFEEPDRIPQRWSSISSGPRPVRRRPLLDLSGVAAQRTMSNHPSMSRPVTHEDADDCSIEETASRSKPAINASKYLDTLNGYIGRNSRFHHLTDAERRKLGGIEYDSITVLSYLVPLYFVLWQLIGAVGMGAWIAINRPSIAGLNGLNPWWTGAFFAVSAFNNSGMALLDTNAVALQKSYYSLLTLGLLILAGNTCFPPFLRLIVWLLEKMIPEASKWHTVFSFILEHPRRVYTNLFPAKQTWWLVASLVVLNGIDWVAFLILNIGNPTLDAIPSRFRALDGLFQAFAVRAGGFSVVSLSSVYPGLLVLYVLMMYVSAFPVTMTIRNTNVYEERSLGIFTENEPKDIDTDPTTNTEVDGRGTQLINGIKRTVTGMHGRNRNDKSPRHTWSNQDFVRQQLRGQLGHDIWWIALAVFLISIIETGQFHRNPVVFSIFNILFEVVSAYGTVGISIGVPWNAYSFCGAWHTGSKLVLCAVMLRGRHRGLPVAIDRAVLLPKESLGWAEEEDQHRVNTGNMAARRRARERDRDRDREGWLAKAETWRSDMEELHELRREKRRMEEEGEVV